MSGPSGNGPSGNGPSGNGSSRPVNSGAARPRPGRRALFSDPSAPASGAVEHGALPEGRRALFSSTVAAEPEPGRLSPVVHCRTCLSATPVSLTALGVALVPSLWLPTRPWPRLMRCPACHRVSWCRIDWPKPF